MSRVQKKGATLKMQAYARRVFNGDGESKKQVALDVGYSSNVSNSVVSHIESKKSFHDAMAKLAYESNNLALAAMEEFKARGFKEFTNAEMIAALNTISGAWSKFSTPLMDRPDGNKDSSNQLRNIVLNRIENQTVIQSDKPVIEQKPEPEPIKEEEKTNLDF